jgi:DNA gyrase/topoisomerase IV subunit B
MECQTIEIKSDIGHVRQCADMYIGSNDSPVHLVTEIMDNALDEILGKYATTVSVTINEETGEVIIEDDGRGIPQGQYRAKSKDDEPFDGQDITDLIFTKHFSSEKFSADVYRRSVGLHGVGAVVVNALSDYVICDVYSKKKKKTTYRFVDGVLKSKKEGKSERGSKFASGTRVTFKPNSKFFTSMTYDMKIIERRLKMFKYLYRDSRLFLNDESIEVSSVSDLHPSFVSSMQLLEITTDDYYFALTYDISETATKRYGYVNLRPVNEGAHLVFINSLLRDAWQEVSNTKFEFDRDDCFLGASILFSVFLSDPKFSSQTKERLTSTKTEVQEAASDLKDDLVSLLNSKKYVHLFTKPLLARFSKYRSSMSNLEKIDYVKEAIRYGEVEEESGKVRVSRRLSSDKLADCVSRSRDETELYIVEGDSAGGTVKKARDRMIHAVLPLRGKSLNANKKSLEVAVKNPEIKALIEAIGIGVAPMEKIENVRYGKIIIAADADPDGSHIQVLLLGSMLKFFPSLIQAGRVYICEAPLFYQRGKGYLWDFAKVDTSKSFQRFKGLGEMNPDQFQETMLNPSKRKLIQIRVANDTDKDYALKLVSSSDALKAMMRKIGLIENGYCDNPEMLNVENF